MTAAVRNRRARLSAGFGLQAAKAVAELSPLEIVSMRKFPVREPVSGQEYCFLAVKTRSGLTGWGECGGCPDAELRALETVWKGKAANQYAAIDFATPLAGALDMALLDILGKACKTPVYWVLGGPTRGKVRAYGSSPGDFSIVTVAVPAPVSRNQGRAYQNQIRALVEVVPASLDFVLNGNGILTPGDAASVAATVAAKHPLWFDEPCSLANLEAVKKVSGETVVPLGFGKGVRDAGVFQALLREGLVDVVRPELSVFGITGTRRIAALAETYYVAVAPRHDGGPVGTAAAIHLAASLPNFFVQHLPVPAAAEDRAMRAAICSPNVEAVQGGFLNLLKAPGLGINMNESALEKYRAS